MNKCNPVAKSLRQRQFHLRVVPSKKIYTRHKEKVKTYANEKEKV